MTFQEKRKEFFKNFLDNLLSRFLKDNKQFWLTYKQSDNIVNNNLDFLEKNAFRDDEGFKHKYYTCIYKNYNVYFNFSAVNRCYCFNAYRIKTQEEEEAEKLQETINYYKKHVSLQSEIDYYITMSLTSIEDNQAILSEKTNPEDIKMWTDGVNNAKKRLAFWQQVKQAISA